MKKTIAILLVLVIGMAGVFAANNSTADLELKTTVAGKYGLKIATRAVTGANLGAKVTDFNDNLTGALLVGEVPFTNEDLTETLYMNYLSNQKIQATVTTAMDPMASESGAVTTKIGYSVAINGGDTVEVGSDDSAVSITFIDEGSIVNGMRVESKEFTITMDEDEWLAAAAATDYTTTWTVTLATI
ncbi:hypothetical protein [uncultured Sphaerochaeta sp.]|uniref:hypothetical protein n=1 Tax=uncultured Sphaerochaeta sp. TaxID=886478 RepID=UPI002A0A82C8|nr:hypothetical protein [uncultured Sphaerochaeta sp.]